MTIIDLFKSIESAAKSPIEADFLDLLQQLDSSIKSYSQLSAAGDAIEQLSQIYNNRAEAKFAEISWLNNPQYEPIIPLSEFDQYVRQSCPLDLDRFMLDRERYYPENRAEAISVDQMTEEVLESIIEGEEPLDVAHEEDIESWVGQTLVALGRATSFSNVARSIPPVQILLSVLLSDGRIYMVRSFGEFYDTDGLILGAT
jgi:hypothetical protein